MALCFLAAGTGERLLRWLGLGDAPPAERAPFALAIGLGCVAYGVLALGLLRLLWGGPVAALVLLLLVGAWRPGMALARDAWSAARARRFRPATRLSAVCAGAVGLLLALALSGALAPPSGSDPDGLSYHLADPAIYLRQRAIVFLFWESHSNFPFTVEMLYTLALMVGSPGAARAVHWLYLALGCVALAVAWRRVWPDAPTGARWLAPLLLASVPIVLWSATVAYNDLTLMVYDGLALLGVWLWCRSGRVGWLWASALCLGLALGTKMTGAVQGLFLAPLVLAAGLRMGKGAGCAMRRLVAWGGIAAALGAPWYVKSYIYTGNPVYPFLYSLFPGTRYWDAACAEAYARHQQTDFGIGHGLGHLLTVPWDLAAYPDRFTDGQAVFTVLFGSLGPALLALAPAALLRRRRDLVAGGLLLFAAGYSIVWFHMTQQTRHLMPVLPLVALASARGAVGLWQERRLSRLAAAGAVGVQSVLAVGVGLLVLSGVLPVLTGSESRDAYLSRTLDVYPILAYSNSELPPDARVLLIHETRGFYLERDYLWGNQGHHAGIPWDSFQNEAAMRRFLRNRLRVTHVLINHKILPREARPGPGTWERPLWEAIHKGTLLPMHEERGFTLYALP